MQDSGASVTQATHTTSPTAEDRADIPAANGGAVDAGAADGAPDPAFVERLRSRLSEELGPGSFRRYFGAAEFIASPGRVDVTAPTAFMADFLSRRFSEALRRAAGICEAPEGGLMVGFRVAPGRDPADRGEAVAAADRADRPGRSATREGHDGLSSNGFAGAPGRGADGGANGAPPAHHDRSDPSRTAESRASNGRLGDRSRHRRGSEPGGAAFRRYRLDAFIEGASNRLALGAARDFAAQDGPTTLSPLFIHSSWGLGKTHLLQGIAHSVLERRPGARVRYTTGELFTNEFIAAVRGNALDAFRKSLRSLDLLCVDDVHFLASKAKTQSELLHTFDAIATSGARLVFASDGHPREIAELSEALVSRLMAGMVVRIDPPDEALRLALVRTLAERRGLALDDAAAQILADRVARFPSGRGDAAARGGSVRDIEGLLTQVEAVARLLPELCPTPGRIGSTLVHRALGLAVTADETTAEPLAPRRPIHVDTIASEVCAYLRVDLTEMMGRGRHKRVVLARSMTAYLSRRLTTLSYPEIARAMRRPNHSTIITAHNRMHAQLRAGDRVAVGSEFDGMTLGEIRDVLTRQIEKAAFGG